MIDPKAEPIENRSPYKRIDLAAKRPSIDDCVHGNCNCANAMNCRYKRCKNCDMPVDQTGNALFDDFYAHGKNGRVFEFYGDEPAECPECKGPMPKL